MVLSSVCLQTATAEKTTARILQKSHFLVFQSHNCLDTSTRVPRACAIPGGTEGTGAARPLLVTKLDESGPLPLGLISAIKETESGG